ncbi:hypothetical protein C0991_005683 [Blastosporella zonata]|nr:hypothetical protein C0991_005683 [Blastosporella zonata]
MTTLMPPDSALNTDRTTLETDLAQAKKEIQILKAADPFNVVEMALEVAVERSRTIEALKARDATVQRLVDAHESIRQKAAAIEVLQQNLKSRANSPFPSDSTTSADRIEIAKLRDEIARLERTIVELRIEIRMIKETAARSTEMPQALENKQLLPVRSDGSSAPSQSSRVGVDADVFVSDPFFDQRPLPSHFPASDEPTDMVAARNAVLAGLPLPEEAPDDTLSPLNIPAPLTIQEFISTLSGTLRTSLNSYRLFYATTTLWCPEREEHGYFYTPAFKCSTNPRIATAHRWSSVDVVAQCFFNKDGIWYYAGIYTAFRLADLTAKEWAALAPEVTQMLVKETILARKNTSPQNVYETTQLYAAGALKVACVALQCVGFNNAMYAALLEQARVFTQSKWAAVTGKASPAPAPAHASAPGLGSGAVWNVNANNVNSGGESAVLATGDVVAGGAGVAEMSLGRRSQNENRNENAPPTIGDGRKR